MKKKILNKSDNSLETKVTIQEIVDFYHLFVDNSQEIFYKLDKDGIFTYVSPSCKHLLGYEVDELEGHSFHELLHPEDKPFLRQALITSNKTPDSKLYLEYRIRHHNGDWRFNASDIIVSKDESGAVIEFNGIARDITQTKRIERALRKNEQKYRSLFENMTTGFALLEIIPDSNGNHYTSYFKEVNPAFENLLYLSAVDVIGRSVNTVFPDIDQRWLDACVGVVKGNPPLLTEFYSKSKNRYFDIRVFSPGQQQYAVTFVDITDRKRSELKILQLSEAVRQSAASIVITDVTGTIEYVNPRFTQVTGYSFEEAVGSNPRILKSGKHTVRFYEDLWAILTSGMIWKGEFHNMKKDGSLFWESSSISPIKNQEGLITHFVAVKEDITARKGMEEELMKAKEVAEESERLKSAFLANMSHEIRTPMNGILGFADLLKESKLSPEEQKEYIEIIETSGRRMLSIINDLIDISKVESGQMQITLSDSNMNDQLRFIYNFFKLEAKQKGLDFSVHCPLENDLAVISTDREKVYAVLTNLIKNAIKFTNQGSITFGYVVKDQMLQFYCKDTGRGIPSDKLLTVFERFRQVDTHLSNGIQGSGLGLAISKAYVEMLGGELWVESELGVGSTFFFTLPYHSKRVVDECEANPSYTVPERCCITGSATILIAEDDPVGLKYLTQLLKKYDFKLLFAENGEDAVQLCFDNENVDLVLMDIKMPVMDGYTAAQVIKGFRSDLPIVAQTALAMEKEKYQDVFDDYLIKPINASELSEVLKKYLVKKTK